MNQPSPQTQSSLHISEEVLATVANEAIRDLKGIHRLAGLPAKFAQKPVKVRISGGVAQLDIGIVAEFGYRLREVCEQVQNAVKNSIQDMTGTAVSKVNVFVTGVHLPGQE